MDYPQHAKLLKRKAEHQWICEFTEFLETRIAFNDRSQESLIAEFFGIDPRAFDAETAQMAKGL